MRTAYYGTRIIPSLGNHTLNVLLNNHFSHDFKIWFRTLQNINTRIHINRNEISAEPQALRYRCAM